MPNHGRKGSIRLLTLIAALIILALPGPANAGRMPRHWHAPKWWLAQAVCVHDHEGAWNDNTGNTYYGGMQFLRSTWEKIGGGHDDAFDHPGDQRRHPFTTAPREQLYRAWLVYLRDGHSWSEWGTAGACGLR